MNHDRLYLLATRYEKRVAYLRDSVYSSRDQLQLADLGLVFVDDSNHEAYTTPQARRPARVSHLEVLLCIHRHSAQSIFQYFPHCQKLNPHCQDCFSRWTVPGYLPHCQGEKVSLSRMAMDGKEHFMQEQTAGAAAAWMA